LSNFLELVAGLYETKVNEMPIRQIALSVVFSMALTLPSSSQVKPPGVAPPVSASKPAPPVQQAIIWDGRWSGSFGARSDIVVNISGNKVVSVTLIGQPLSIAASTVAGNAVSISGPDFSMTMTQVAPANAQGTYENNRKEKATALLSKN
jgi:hypothetical protein